MRFYQILLEDFKTAKKKFLDDGAESSNIDSVFADYKKLRNRMSPPQNNIDWWASNRNFVTLQNYVKELSGVPTSREMKKAKTGKTIILSENNEWLIVIPLDKDASCFHGKNTDWCTTKPFQNYYEQYFYKNEVILIYCINKASGNKWAIATHKELNEREYFDRDDNSIDKEEFNKQTGLNSDKLVSLATGKQNLETIGSSREYYKELISKLNKFYYNRQISRGKHNLEAEAILIYIKDRERILTYFSEVGPSSEYNINLQKIAVNQDPYILQFIKNPEKSVVIMALKRDGYLIQYIEDQSEDMKKMAVATTPSAIRLIQTPISEEIQISAISRDGNLIAYVDEPSEKVQLIAVSQKRKTRDNIALEHILKKGIKPSNAVIMASVENEPHSSLYTMIKYNLPLNENIIITAINSAEDDAGLIIRLLRDEDIEITIPMQKEAVKNNPYSVLTALLSYNKGVVDEGVQIEAAATDGYQFVTAYSRYKMGENPPTPRAIEEAFKTGHLIEKTIDKVIRAKIEPTYQAFKNAIDNAPEDYNATIIDILQYAFPFGDTHDRLVAYARNKAIKDKNKMLMILIKEYKDKNNLDNLSFEPEN